MLRLTRTMSLEPISRSGDTYGASPLILDHFHPRADGTHRSEETSCFPNTLPSRTLLQISSITAGFLAKPVSQRLTITLN